MEGPTKPERKKIFLEELHLLLEEDYITGKQFNEIARAHHQYYREMQIDGDIKTELTKVGNQQSETIPSLKIKLNRPSQVKPKPKQIKKKLTAEELRERNITWSLNLGVILLLISGLFVATSNWATMPNWKKSGLIGLVSFLFFGISYLSKRVLKIDKTGLAFIVLGSLFLPIFLLSISWFELLGPFLSFSGEGRYIFGLLSCIALVPIYITIARKLSSRLFVWFSYLTITAGVAFLLGALYLSLDWFYFGLMLYNVLTVAVFHQLKKRDALKLFTNELVAFSQIQLILSSLLTLIFYENLVINGVNILLTAVVYLGMVFVSEKKEYHFIFSTMIVYGAYQVIEHSLLANFAEVLFVIVGIGFLAVPRMLDNKEHWRKVFQLTSAVVSLAAFIYISLQAFYVNMQLDTPSAAIFLAYLLLAGQFVYLSNRMKVLLFHYLSPVFFAAAMFELVSLVKLIWEFENRSFYISIIGFILISIFGFLIKHPYLNIIKQSSRDVGLVIMLVGLIMTLVFEKWLQLGILFLLLAVAFYISIQVEKRKTYMIALPWLLPISLALFGSSIGEQLRTTSEFYYLHFGIAMNAIVGSGISFLAYYSWSRIKHKGLANNSFVIGQFFYSFALFFALTFAIDEQWVRPAILLGGIIVYIVFYQVKKYQWLTYLVGIVSLLSYFVMLQSVYSQIQVPTSLIYLENTLASLLLLTAGYLVKRKSAAIANGLFWIGHLYLPVALLFSFFIFAEKAVWSFLVAAVLYFASTYLSTIEWKMKAFLYCGFTAIYLWIVTGMLELNMSLEPQFAFLFTSLVMFGYWLIASPEYKTRTKYYFVPFSILGIAAIIGTYPYTLTLFLVTVAYSFGLLVYLIFVKWNIMTFVPLLLFFSATLQYLQPATFPDEYKLIIVSVTGIVLLIIGKMNYQHLHELDEKGAVKQFDGYTVIAFLFFGSGYLFITEQILTVFVPGFLISFALWLQHTRIPEHIGMWVKVVSGIYLMEPYYAAMTKLNVPELFETEVKVLPLVAVTIYLQRSLSGKYKRVTSKTQWAVLIFVAIVLVQDGLESSTIYDALLLGTLSLLSMLAGMFWKVKSFFLVGSGVLLLNVLLQTRPLWGNMPWWAYLLVAGSILIIVASFNEWNKQKMARGEITGLMKLKQKIVTWYHKWD